MCRSKFNVQAIKKYQRALRNVKLFNIVDEHPLESPDSREKSSKNYITTIPNTFKNIQAVRKCLNHTSLVFRGRGPRTSYVRKNARNYYGGYSGDYPMRLNPPYVSIYKR